jgi:hypothetical protein
VHSSNTIGSPISSSHSSNATKKVESKLFQCLKCKQNAIMLIFAPDAQDNDDLRHYVAQMQNYMQEYDVPTWVIGPEKRGPSEDESAFTLKAWPTMGDKVYMIRSSEMNQIIGQHETDHCS